MKKNEIIAIYGENPLEMTKKLMAVAEVEKLIGGKNKHIGIKPNLVLASPASGGATTHPEIAAGIIEYLRDNGFSDIVILEGSWVGDRTQEAFRVCGYTELAKKYGVRLIDLQKDTFKQYDCKGVPIGICDEAMRVEFMFNLPVLKGHCQTLVTGALKNGKGLIPNSEKRRFHSMGLHKPIAHLNTRLRNDFIIVDGICGDLDFEEGGNPVVMNRMFAALDPVLCDSYICELMGYSPKEVPYITMAAELGVGSLYGSDSVASELNRPEGIVKSIRSGRKVERLVKHTDARSACSACYGSLIHALARLENMGELENIKIPICIGQGFREKTGEIGVGNCTCGFRRSLKGCPPSAKDMLDFIIGETGKRQ